MSEENIEKKNWNIKKAGSIFIKISLVLIVLVSIGIGILSIIVATQTETIKTGIEDHLSHMTKADVRIETINRLALFPDIIVDFEDLRIQSYPDLEEDSDDTRTLFLSLDAAKISMPFFSYFLGDQRFNDLHIENLFMAKDFLTPKALKLDHVKPEKTEHGESFILANGTYGGRALNASMNLQQKGDKGFALPKNRNLEIKLGDLGLTSQIKKTGRFLHFQDFTLKSGKSGGRTIDGDLKLRTAGMLALKGDVRTGSSDIYLDIKRQENNLNGLVYSKVFDLADIEPIRLFSEEIQDTLLGKRESKPIDFGDLDADLNIEIESLKNQGHDLGGLRLSVRVWKNHLQVEDVSGEILRGPLKGHLSYKIEEGRGNLETNIELLQFNYGALQDQIDGKANVKIDLQSQGLTTTQLSQNLNGHIGFIAGEGQMKSAVINKYGAGLLNAILPNLDPESETQLNCGIAEFELNEGVAQSKTLFIDTKRVTVVGNGDINFNDRNVNLSLKPNSKNPALLDVATSVNVGGPFDNISVSPDVFSLGKKLGSLLLGTINPAFLVFSLTDFGLTDNHPCASYIKEEQGQEEKGQGQEEEQEPQETPQNEEEKQKAPE